MRVALLTLVFWDLALSLSSQKRLWPSGWHLLLRMRAAKISLAYDTEDDTWWKKRLGQPSAFISCHSAPEKRIHGTGQILHRGLKCFMLLGQQ